MPGQAKELYRCRRLDAIAARWDRRAAKWEGDLKAPGCVLNQDDGYARFLRAARKWISQNRRFCSQRGVIDAGCGTGLVLETLIPSFRWGVGVDISPGMIEQASAKNLPNARFVVADCFDLARCCPRAAAVVSRGVLLSHYGPRHGQELLQSALRVLEPGGAILFDFLNADGRKRYGHDPEEKVYYSREQGAALARSAGFGRIKVWGRGGRRALFLLAQRED